MTVPVGAQRRAGLLALAVFLGTLLAYAGTLDNDFVTYDDDVYLTRNPEVAGGLTPRAVAWAFTSVAHTCNWHPVTWLSHLVDVSLFGLEHAGGHHAVSVLLHALNAVLLLFALRALTGRVWCSALAAAVFALHPLRVESVAWIAERKDLLAGTSFLACLWLYARWFRSPSRARHATLAAVFALGLMAKPTVVTLPCVLLVLDRWPLARTEPLLALAREKAVLFALSAAGCVMTLISQSLGKCTDIIVDAPGPLARLANAGIAYAQYLAKAVWPVDLAFFYPHPAIVDPDGSRAGATVGAVLLLTALTAGAVTLRRRVPAALAGWLLFLGMLVPAIGVVQVGGQALADRYAYLPLIGVEVAVVWAVASWVGPRRAARRLAVALALLACFALGLRTRDQVEVWRDSRTLFEHADRVTERNYAAQVNLGLMAAEEGEALARAGDARAGRARIEDALPLLRTRHRVRPRTLRRPPQPGLGAQRARPPRAGPRLPRAGRRAATGRRRRALQPGALPRQPRALGARRARAPRGAAARPRPRGRRAGAATTRAEASRWRLSPRATRPRSARGRRG